MNTGSTKQYDEFVFRRLTEPVSVFGTSLSPMVWLAVLIVVLIVGLIYVGIMYSRDSRGVGILWAGVLGLLRLSVYAALAFIFLLPSRQTWEETSSSSKVLVLVDTSLSMTMTRDDLPANGVDFDKMPTRSEKVLGFLQDPKVDFFPSLTKKNPVTVFRFATGVDNEFMYLDTDGRSYTKDEYAEIEEKMRQGLYRKDGDSDKRPWAEGLQREFFIPRIDPKTAGAPLPNDIGNDDKDRYEKLVARNKMLAQRKWFSATNLGDATLNTVERELNNMVQGIVIFTDGNSTEGSDSTFTVIQEKATKAGIPIFVVGIGDVRPQVRIDITDLRAPKQVQPEDKWRVKLEVTGEGLADKEFPVELHLTHTRKKEDGKEEPLKIYLMEQQDKKNPKKPADLKRIDLNDDIILRPENLAKFDSSNPPAVELEYAVDAAALAKANVPPIELDKSKKWEIGVTGTGDPKENAALRLQAFVKKDPLELFTEPFHKSDKIDVIVVKRPLKVLLFASAATHDFQFLNNMLIRERDQSRAELAVYVQPPPGKANPEDWYKTVVFGVEPDRLLTKFPERLNQPDDPVAANKIYDLKEYDVIVAFDPDWTKLSNEQLQLVQAWCDKGGGIVMVGGPINTLQLARPGENRAKLKPILDLLPVILKDVRIDSLDRNADNPWKLEWDTVTPEMEFMTLTEESETPIKFDVGWNEFFYGKDGNKGVVKRGFYNYYPTETVKTGSIVVARFGDPRAKMKDGTQMPYIVLSDAVGSGRRVVWIAWLETRRLRQHSEAFYERFWIKLLRYTGAGNQTSLTKRVHMDLGRQYTAGKYVSADFQIDDMSGQPLEVRKANEMPKVVIKLPAGADAKEIPTEYPLVARKVKVDSDKGKFSVRFLVKSPGDYQLQLEVKQAGETVLGKFNVKESNPELDDTRPNFKQMYDLASDAADVLARIPSEADRNAVKTRLAPPPMPKSNDKNEVKDGKPRLYFSLKDAELIPTCMKTVTNTKQIRGPYKDEWDDWTRFEIWKQLGLDDRLSWIFNSLVLIVGLLSMEWLLRKLLRLA